MARYLAATAALVACLWATSAQARLDGALRQSFTDTAQKSCVAKQKTMPTNEGISDNLLSGYCTCVAGYIADNASPDQLMLAAGDIKRGTPSAWLTTLQKQASEFCVTNLRDYVKAQ